MTKSWKLISRWLLVLSMSLIAANLNTPLSARIRNWDILILLGICLTLISIIIKGFPKLKPGRILFERILFLMVIIAITCFSIGKETLYFYKKYKVLNAPSDQLRYLGSHFIVGYRDYEEIRKLVAKGAIAGVYITHHNVRGKRVEQVRKEIRKLQEIQKSLGLPPLIIAADQEGGIVSRLSPPLSSLPPLSALLSSTGNSDELNEEIIQYASVHARELSDLGVNMNLGPVVDLRMEKFSRFPDFHTRICERAISDDKFIVASVALLYSKILEKYGVIPTLKHFPGLGRVREDTHYSDGELDLELTDLEENDWIPFRRIIQQTGACMMLGHVRLRRTDPNHPVSFSEKVVQGIIRQKWKHNGILITDDLNMKPAYASKGGIGGAAIKALNAGVDLLLISYDGAQYYEAMHAVIRAFNRKKLNSEIIEESNRRLLLTLVSNKNKLRKCNPALIKCSVSKTMSRLAFCSGF